MRKVYSGVRDKAGNCTVQVEGIETYLLPGRQDLIRFSDEGFNWGHSGSGPTQLALAILADHLKAAICKPGLPVSADAQLAITYCYRFRRLFLEHVRKDEWSILDRDVELAIKEFGVEDLARGAR